MEHTNQIAIDILTSNYADYPANAWHYDDIYRMLVEAQERKVEAMRKPYYLGKVPTEPVEVVGGEGN